MSFEQRRKSDPGKLDKRKDELVLGVRFGTQLQADQVERFDRQPEAFQPLFRACAGLVLALRGYQMQIAQIQPGKKLRKGDQCRPGQEA